MSVGPTEDEINFPVAAGRAKKRSYIGSSSDQNAYIAEKTTGAMNSINL